MYEADIQNVQGEKCLKRQKFYVFWLHQKATRNDINFSRQFLILETILKELFLRQSNSSIPFLQILLLFQVWYTFCKSDWIRVVLKSVLPFMLLIRLRDRSREIFRLLWFLNIPEICSLFVGVLRSERTFSGIQRINDLTKKIKVNQRL